MTDDGSRDDGARQERAGQERAGQERASDGGAGQDKIIDGAQPAPDDPIAAEMAALFAVALSDEPPSRVSPLSVIAEARRGRAIGAHRRRTWLVGVAAAAVLVTAGVVVVPRMLSGTGSATAASSPMAVSAASGVAGSASAAAASSAADAAAPEGASDGAGAEAASTPTTVAQADSGGGKASEASQPTGPAGGNGYSVAAGTGAAGEGNTDTARAPGPAAATSTAASAAAAASSAASAGCAWTELGADAVAAARAALPAGMVDHAASLSGPCDPAAVAGAVLVPAGTDQGGTASSGPGQVAGITVTITREGPGACLQYPADGRCVPTGAPDAFDVGTRQVFVYAGGLQTRLDLDPGVGEQQPTVQQLAAAGRAVLATFG